MSARIWNNIKMTLRSALLVLTGLLFVAPAPAAARPPQDAASKARVVSEQAIKFFERKDFSTAAKLFLQAFDLDPAPDYLYSAGRAEMDAGQLPEAQRDFQRLVETTDASNRFYAKAQARLVEVGTALAAKAVTPPPRSEQPAKVPAPLEPGSGPTVAPEKALPPEKVASVQTVQTKVNAPSPEPAHATNWPGRIAAGTGAAACVGAAYLLASAAFAQNDLDAKRTLPGAVFNPKLISLSQAKSTQESINTRIVAGWVTGGIGVAALGLGAWLWTKDASRVTIAPALDSSGVVVAGRF